MHSHRNNQRIFHSYEKNEKKQWMQTQNHRLSLAHSSFALFKSFVVSVCGTASALEEACAARIHSTSYRSEWLHRTAYTPNPFVFTYTRAYLHITANGICELLTMSLFPFREGTFFLFVSLFHFYHNPTPSGKCNAPSFLSLFAVGLLLNSPHNTQYSAPSHFMSFSWQSLLFTILLQRGLTVDYHLWLCVRLRIDFIT